MQLQLKEECADDWEDDDDVDMPQPESVAAAREDSTVGASLLRASGGTHGVHCSVRYAYTLCLGQVINCCYAIAHRLRACLPVGFKHAMQCVLEGPCVYVSKEFKVYRQ